MSLQEEYEFILEREFLVYEEWNLGPGSKVRDIH